VSELAALFANRLASVVPDALGVALAAELRARLDQVGFARYALRDRGSYGHAEVGAERTLLGALTRLAGQHTGRRHAFVDARALRLGPGDYLLTHHDRVHAEPLVELTLDLSPAVVPGAEVHYRRAGQVYFRVGSLPGALAIVERDADVTCNHTYVSRRHADAEVVRLVVRLRDAL